MKHEYYSWVSAAKGYLEVPKLCCQEILDPKRNRLEGDPSAPQGWTMGYYVDNLISVILYNIKHGIEAFLKAILLRFGVPKENTHNLQELFSDVRTLVEGTTWVPIIINNGNQEILSQTEINRVQSQVLDLLEPLVDYFYFNRFLDEKLGIGDIPDPSNELFRYPRMKSGDTYDHAELCRQLTTNDIEELWSKIDQLIRHLCDIGYLIAVDARHNPRKS